LTPLIVVDHLNNSVGDVRIGVPVISPPSTLIDEDIERILQDIADEQAAESAAREPVRWPTQNPVPINEYTTEGYMTMAFPCLFPHGNADFRDHSRRQTELGLADYLRSLMLYEDGRFGRHPRYLDQ